MSLWIKNCVPALSIAGAIWQEYLRAIANSENVVQKRLLPLHVRLLIPVDIYA